MVLIRNSWNWPEILIERAERFPVCWYFLIKMDELSQTYQTFCWHSLSFDPPASSLSASHFTSVIRMEEESVGAVSHSLVILMAAQSSFHPVSPSAFLVPFPVLHCYSGKLCAARKLFVFNKRSIVVFVAKTMLVAHWLAFSWHPTFIMSFPPWSPDPSRGRIKDSRTLFRTEEKKLFNAPPRAGAASCFVVSSSEWFFLIWQIRLPYWIWEELKNHGEVYNIITWRSKFHLSSKLYLKILYDLLKNILPKFYIMAEIAISYQPIARALSIAPH